MVLLTLTVEPGVNAWGLIKNYNEVESMYNCSAERLRKIVELKRSSVNHMDLVSDEQEVSSISYDFEITKYTTFRAKSNNYNFVKFTFLLSNEFESFEEEQVFSYDDNMNFGKRYQEFIQQFAKFIELAPDNEFENFVGEKGTCHVINIHQNLNMYRKIMIDSLEVSDDE